MPTLVEPKALPIGGLCADTPKGFVSEPCDRDFPEASRESFRIMRGDVYRFGMWWGIRTVNDPAWAREMLIKAVKFDRRQALHPKIILGLGLSMLSASQLRRLNQLAAMIRPSRGHSNHVEH